VILPLFAAAGYWAALKSKDVIAEQNDMLVTGAFAGVLAGVISSIVWIVLSILFGMAILSLLIPMSDQYSAAGILPAMGVSSLIHLIGGLVCCLPTYVVLGAIMGALGGLIYDNTKK